MSEFPRTYKEAGVDIEFLDKLKAYGREISRKTKNQFIQEIGGRFFLDLEPVRSQPMERPPLLIHETDGIGTKEDLLLEWNMPFMAGWDLAAANLNDVIRCGAKPVAMSVNIALQNVTGKEFKALMGGIKAALVKSECALISGETAIHPNLAPGKEKAWHLSGTAIGYSHEHKIITGEQIEAGDVILGLPSSGIHTNGMSLATAVLGPEILNTPTLDNRRIVDFLLTPSKLYVEPVLSLVYHPWGTHLTVHGLTHVTGGGLAGRLAQLMPSGFCATVNQSSFTKPKIFELIQVAGNISTEEMYKTFNMGIGFVVIVPPQETERAKEILSEYCKVFEIGYIEANPQAKFTLI